MDNEQERRDILKWLLGQTYRAEKRKRQLDERLLLLREKMESPLNGTNYDPMPKGGGDSDGAAALIFKMAEIEERILTQQEEIGNCVLRVMDILEKLPVDSLEREIMEMRHIDMMQWWQIQDAIPMSKAQCHRHYNAGIDILLQMPEVAQLVEENRDRFGTYVFNKNMAELKRAKKQSGVGFSENIFGNFQGENSAGCEDKAGVDTQEGKPEKSKPGYKPGNSSRKKSRKNKPGK